MKGPLDSHVHLRDREESYKETIKHALDVANKAGLSGIIGMPNTKPPILNEMDVDEMKTLVNGAKSLLYCGFHGGLLPRICQIKKSVQLHKKHFPFIAGLKLYAGPSVGNLAIEKEIDQMFIYDRLAKEEYKGVLVVHCEKEKLLRNDLFNPKKPITHTLARPPEAEIESVKDQIKFAYQFGFASYSRFGHGNYGHLHITHVSDPRSVDLINEAKRKLNISCAVTPHHCLLDKSIMERRDGILWKMNPPLNTRKAADKLLEYLRDGKIDFVSSDHAPHTLKDKKKGHMSGIPNLQFWPHFINILKEKGFSEKRIEEITFDNVVKIYNLPQFKINEPTAEPKFDYNLKGEYPYDPYKHLKR